MRKREVKIETPGEPTADAPAEADAVASDASHAGNGRQPLPKPAVEAESGKSGDMTPEQEAQLAKDLTATAALVGSDQALDWSHLNTGLPAAQERHDPDKGLPDDADPDTITEPVLTKAGWVLPTKDARARSGPA